MTFEIRNMIKEDWEDVKDIYVAGIATGNATFELTPPSYVAWNASHHPLCRFVAVEGTNVIGWVSLSPVSSRSCYAGVGEVSVYVAPKAIGKGVGTALLNRLIEESEKLGYWTLQSSIFPENEASLQLHKKVGFRVVGFREKLGKLNGRWRDTVFLERRSKKI
ncbi:N-acetyltransferase [Ureibacillus sp. Re31]|uniref:N-acetyltransferase n=1 Tax=Ureibacillus galli TaxID=2762222 RepID=A0ABR8X8S6_9BACL|nr:GNAT family N-acetyltransferase [Ureibacillus galli]MBD8025588.1 N-acetyltransferase [Ureibacillus galli]